MPLLVPTVVAWIAALTAGAAWPHLGRASAWAAALGALLLLPRAARVRRGTSGRTVPQPLLQPPLRPPLRPSLPPLPAVLLVVALAGHAVGAARALTDRQCAAVLAASGTVQVRLDGALAPGRPARGVASGAGPAARCRVPASVRVTSGRADAGAIVAVAGTMQPTTRGLRVSGRVTARLGSSVRLRWRARAAATIDDLFGARAPLARALLIAEQDDIPAEMRDRFADAGLVHVLSVSGLHVAIIAGAIATLAGAARLPRHAATGVALVAVAAYVALLGAPPPALRSAVMYAVVALSGRLQRPVHPWTALALGAALPTADPAVVRDLGWQLSVSGMAALVAARAVLRRWRTASPSALERRWRRLDDALQAQRRLEGWRAALLRELVSGVAATLVTAPLVAWHFGRIALVAPVANVAAGPVVALLQPALFLALLLAGWPAAARLVAAAAGLLMAALDAVATAAAGVPHGVLWVAPGRTAAIACGVAVAALVRASAARRPMPALLVAAAALVVAVWSPFLARAPGQLELHLLDVGQGDALALRTPRGRWVLVDAGRRWDGGDAGRRTIIPYVRRRGGRVALLVATHAHEDHVGGAATVVRALRPARWWEPGFVGTSPGYRDALAALAETRTPWRRVHPGDRLELDGVQVRVLGPDSAWTAALDDANEASVVLLVRYGRRALLLAGDAERREEAWLVARWGDSLAADVLKLAHHGSRTSSTPAFVDAVVPRLGLVSVGAGNRYGHPSPEVLAEFTARGVPLLRTDEDGTVIVRTDGDALEVEVRGGRWRVP